jgi:hypothetical protein
MISCHSLSRPATTTKLERLERVGVGLMAGWNARPNGRRKFGVRWSAKSSPSRNAAGKSNADESQDKERRFGCRCLAIKNKGLIDGGTVSHTTSICDTSLSLLRPCPPRRLHILLVLLANHSANWLRSQPECDIISVFSAYQYGCHCDVAAMPLRVCDSVATLSSEVESLVRRSLYCSPYVPLIHMSR